MINRKVGFAVLTMACLTAVLLVVTPTRSGNLSGGAFDQLPSLNTNEATAQYDSGWLDITDKCGQYFNLIHDLNSTDITVDIQGKARVDGGVHQRNIGGTGYTPGWSATYGGTNYDYAYSMVKTADGGYALAGSTDSFGAGLADAWLIKTDANGIMQWNKTYGGTSYDYAYSVVRAGDGGYALAGITESLGAGGYDFWLIKTDANGITQWNKTYGGTNGEYLHSMVQTADGGYALAGETESLGAGMSDFWLIKTDANGIMQWGRTYGGTQDDYASSLVQAVDGGYALAGYTESFGAGGGDFWFVKTDASGNARWNMTYGGAYDDWAGSVVQTVDGGYALAGSTYSLGAGISDAWLIKTDTNGSMQWGRTYGGYNGDTARSVVQTVDGGYALAGSTASFGAGSLDAWLVKTDAHGIMQWQRTYGGTTYDFADSIVQTANGGYVLAGDTQSFGAGDSDVYLVKTEAESGLIWTDSTANTITLYRGATDPYWNFVRVSITIRPSASLFLVVRGMDNGIYYRFFNETTSTWDAWKNLPGATLDSPAAAIVGNELRVVVRGMDGSSLWYGTVDVATDVFSGWTLLSGATPSAPELASSGTTPP